MSGEGETLTASLPSPRSFIIRVDPVATGSPFTVVTECLPSRAKVPAHRHRYRDFVLVVYHGQGRCLLERKPWTLVPGVVLFVPRQQAIELHNTGTGILQLAWISAPPGFETCVRELSRLGAQADPTLLRDVAERHGIEVEGVAPSIPEASAKPSELPQPRPGRAGRHRHRGGRSRRRHPPSGTPQAPPAASDVATPPAVIAPAPSPSPAPAPPAASPRASPRARGERSRPRRSRVKEVYMGGRWVKVSGEGPVIAP